MDLTLKDKFPLFYLGSLLDDMDFVPSEEYKAERQRLSHQQDKLRDSGEEYVRDFSAFLGSSLHDSEIYSMKLDHNTFTISMNDGYLSDCCGAISGLLNLKIDEDKLQFPLRIHFERVRNLSLYRACENGNLIPIDLNDSLSKIDEYRYDEILSITPNSIHIVFEGAPQADDSLLLEVEAGQLRFEHRSRENFADLLGPENLDIFDSLWEKRKNKTLWPSDYEGMVRFVRALRPEMPKDYDIGNFYIQFELGMRAQDAIARSDFEEAIKLLKEKALGDPRVQTYEMLAECLMQVKQYREAILYLYAANGVAANLFKPRYLLAQSWYELGNPSNAAHELHKCLELNPKYKKALNFKQEHETELKPFFEYYVNEIDEDENPDQSK